jgi:cellulose synthase/poly-beta-1,6-N-acetylglucosamine synthase-like glycosyltransferase
MDGTVLADRRPGVYRADRPATFIAIVPAHNEEETISAAVTSLWTQDRRPDAIYVIADNCTDNTVQVAESLGAQVVTTHDNQYKKAGALNQLLDEVLPRLGADDLVLVMDADSHLDPGFLTAAEEYLVSDRRLAGVGGSFRGGPGGGWVGTLQRNEYARYARDVRRLRGKVLVLTGTAAVFRVSALRAVVRGRSSGSLPAGSGVYDTSVLTEDNELTLALRHLGYQVLSPLECTLVTEVMPSWAELYKQRLRWKRGALENLCQYGFTRITWRYWGRQALTALGCVVTAAYLATLVSALVAERNIHLQAVWLGVTAIFAVERVITVQDRGWRQMLLGATVVAEMPFDIFLQGTNLVAYAQSLLRRERRW